MHLGPKVKIDYIVLNAKLLLININYVKFFFFLESLDTKNLTKLFTLVDVVD